MYASRATAVSLQRSPAASRQRRAVSRQLETKGFAAPNRDTWISWALATLAHARFPAHPRLAASARTFDRSHRLAHDFARKGHAKLRAQLANAAHSISTNIVEGCGAVTHKEFARFLDISIKSADETEYHLLASHDLGLISDAAWKKYTTEAIEVRKMIHAYRVAVLRDDGGPGDGDRGRAADG